MNTTDKIRKFYLILCPDDRCVIARQRRGPNFVLWSDEDIWELQEISEDWYPISAAAYMYPSRETPNGWSVKWKYSINIKNQAILYASRFLAEELG